MTLDTLLTRPEDIEQALSNLDGSENLVNLLDKLNLTDFSGLDLSQSAAAEFGLQTISFQAGEFMNRSFNSADISKAEFRQMDILRCNFQNCTANFTQFNFCTLAKSLFNNAIMKRAMLLNCDISGCVFTDAQLTEAVLYNLTQSVTDKLRNSPNSTPKDLEETVLELQFRNDVIVFRKCNLRNADLSNSCFFGADFQGANLNEVNFTGADLRYANLVGVHSDAGLLDAQLSHSRMTRDMATFYDLRFCSTANPDIVEIDDPPHQMSMTG